MIKEVIILVLIIIVFFSIVSFIKKAVSKTFEIIFKLSVIAIAIILILTAYGAISFFNAGYFEESEILMFSENELLGGLSIEDGKIKNKYNAQEFFNETNKENIIKMIESEELENIFDKKNFIITEIDNLSSNLNIYNNSNNTGPFKAIKEISKNKDYNISFKPKTFGAKFAEIFMN
ncbi:MAG: hypothetical protein ACQER9_03665 [Nanobdellota archaeon]